MRSNGGRRPIHGFFHYFNAGFNWLSSRYGRMTGRLVRMSALMLVLYAVIIGVGLNEFRKAPQGFIPQQDLGYLIVAAQLPPGASLERTDAVMKRATELALETPGVMNAINIVGFSGATFTNAPNAGAIFVILDPFDKRAKDPRRNRQRASRAPCSANMPRSRKPSSSSCSRRRCRASATPAVSA